MKLIDALNQCDKTRKNTNFSLRALSLAANVNIRRYEFDTDKTYKWLTSYWVTTYQHTGENVGIAALYLHEKLVGYMESSRYQSDVDVEYIDVQSARKVREFLLSCVDDDDDDYMTMSLDEAIEEWQPLNRFWQLDAARVRVRGRDCIVVSNETVNYEPRLTVQYYDGTNEVLGSHDYPLVTYRILTKETPNEIN